MKLITMKFHDWDCEVSAAQYGNGNTALSLTDAQTGEAVAVATVNFEEMSLPSNQVAIKDWSENAGMFEALVVAGIASPTGMVIQSGFVEARIVELNPDVMKALGIAEGE